MKKFISLAIVMLFAAMTLHAEKPVYTKVFTDKAFIKQAKKWAKSGEWRNGFMAAKPHKSVNLAEWYSQYQKNPEQWKALFTWLANNDITTISGGRHPIEGTQLVVSVEDSQNEPLLKRQSESHYKHIDFQYVVKGSERFGIIDHLSSKPNCEYRPDVIHYDYAPQKAKFYDSTPKEFFIFFPCDWHIAKVATPKQNQNIRVIVIKVDYID
jgi:biofilm protein TabA